MTEKNPLTGLYFSHSFFEQVEAYLGNGENVTETYCMVAVDLEHFRLFNKMYGREQGDVLLMQIAGRLNKITDAEGGIAGYLGGDNFGLLIPYKQELIKQLSSEMKSAVRTWNHTAGFLPAIGVYKIEDTDMAAATMYDKATVALGYVIGNYTRRICEYTSDMEEKVEEEIKLLSEIQDALENDEFTFFVQPQCDIATGKIIGGESLVRWFHGDKGMISPGVFVPVLEKNGFIADLDRYIWDKVCQWLRSWIDRGYQPVPISINVSRIDIFSMDVPAYLNGLLAKYNLPTRLLKVEITESAYAESNEKIIKTVKELRDEEFLVMMDDFGSGYSSLNMLKSVAVDVLKLDMRFLDIDEKEEEKGIGILESVVNMARQMRMPIIVEGVETQVQENFLMKMGCRYSQGYYYYKPMSIENFEKLIMDERRLDLNGLLCRQIESIHLKEFLDNNLFTDTMLNNMLGAAAFYDMYENQIEITRVNEQYYRLAGISVIQEAEHSKKFWNHVRDDDRQRLFSIFIQAYENPVDGAQGYVHYVRADGTVLWVFLRVYFMREKDGHKLFYASLCDMTEWREKKHDDVIHKRKIEVLQKDELEQLEEYYENLPCGYAISKVMLDEQDAPCDYDIIYANREITRLSNGDIDKLKQLMERICSANKEELLDKIYRAAYLGERVEAHLYSSVSCRYLKFTFGQYQYGYVSCMMQDETHAHIYEKTMNAVLHTFREVHFLHLQENYCRMLYPDDNHLLERGNYEELINRHYTMGRVLRDDEENVRRFLSLQNLREVLKQQDSVEYKYRRSIQGKGDEWCLTTFSVCERENGIPKTAIITIRSIEAIMREAEDTRHRDIAKTLTTLSDGFFVYDASGNEEILYANPHVWKLYGCDTLEEFRELTGNSFAGMVHPDDLKRVQWEIREQIKQTDRKMDFIYYRIIRKDGSVRWIDDCGHLEETGTGENQRLFYVLLSDATDLLYEAQKEQLIMLSEIHNREE